MSISKNDNSYQTEAKEQWREYIYSLLSPDICSTLVDKDGNITCKWLEPVGDNATTFNQLLSTGKIQESQLIGLDIREDNITSCNQIFPLAQFHFKPWESFCKTYPNTDIGVIVFDLVNAAYGDSFRDNFKATMQLAHRCKKSLGEVLVVVNVDASKTYRACSYHKGETVEVTFKRNIENVIRSIDYHPYFTNFTINIDTMKRYKQHTRSADMLSVGFIL